jgi:CDP-diacylglycerol--serine O-phosphatidyltransferase
VVTLVGLVVGVSSIRFALESAWEKSVYCILIATIIDGLDGRVARMLNATSHFGAELDSLCDFINFGLCPALLLYLWSFQQYEYKVISWASIMLFVVCMAIRLARFNTAIVENDKDKKQKDTRFFTGVPAPSGAILALIPMILDFELVTMISEFSVRNHTLLINLYIVIIALLLASSFPTISLKNIQIKPEYLSLSMIISAMIIIVAIIYPWYSLPIAAIIYILSIPPCIYYARKF